MLSRGSLAAGVSATFPHKDKTCFNFLSKDKVEKKTQNSLFTSRCSRLATDEVLLRLSAPASLAQAPSHIVSRRRTFVSHLSTNQLPITSLTCTRALRQRAEQARHSVSSVLDVLQVTCVSFPNYPV